MEKKPSEPGTMERVFWWIAFLVGLFVAMYAGILLFWPKKKEAPPSDDTVDVDHVVVEETKKAS